MTQAKPKVRRKSKHEQALHDALEEAKADCIRMRRIEQIACRDAAQAMSQVDAIAHAASAAEALLDARMPNLAREILRTIKHVHIDALRDRVSREPGGVNHNKTWVYRGTVELKDGIMAGPVGSPAGGDTHE